MPDQYTLSAFARSELTGPQHVPVMAEIDLVSSHTPWAPLPRLVDWNRVGDGSVFNGMPEQGLSPAAAWDQPGGAGAAYQLSIGYSMSTVISFVQTYGTKDLVVVALGDHQPATIVTGEGASHDVPITVIACEFPSSMLVKWIAGGNPYVAELARIRDVEYVDLPTGHWPQFTRPTELGEVIRDAVRSR